MGKMDPLAVLGVLKDLINKAKKSKDPAVKKEALKTMEAVRSLRETVEKKQ